MIHVVCSVRDLKAEIFSRPFYTGRVGEALRSFQDEVVQGDPATSLIAKHPADFELWHVADWDDESSSFSVPKDGTRLLARGSDFAK